MIGANEAPPAGPIHVRPPEQVTAAARPMMIGLEEAFPATREAVPVPPPIADEPGPAVGPSLISVREAPVAGEMDLVVTPLLTPDDWHHFELALRRVPGVGPLRIEYYRGGILKLRLQWSGAQRFASAVVSVPGYRVGILGEDRNTVQIRVVPA